MYYEKGVSIIIPIYNAEYFLENCLNTVTNQSYKNLEIICVLDKKSDDKSESILKNFAVKDERIKIIYDTSGKGQGYNRNLGIEHATKEYIGFVDADDYIDIDYYEHLVDAIEMFHADVAMGDICIVKYPSNNVTKEKRHPFKMEYLLTKKINISDEPVCWDKIYKTELIKDNPELRFPEETMYESTLFLLKVMDKCKKLITVPDACYYWLKNGSSLSYNNKYAPKHLDDSNIVIHMILDYLKQLNLTKEDNFIVIDFFMKNFGKLAFNFPLYREAILEKIKSLTTD